MLSIIQMDNYFQEDDIATLIINNIITLTNYNVT